MTVFSRGVAKKLVDGLMNDELCHEILMEIREWFKSEVSEKEKYDALEEIFNGLVPDEEYDSDVERCLAEQHKRLGFVSGGSIRENKGSVTGKAFSRKIVFRVAAVFFPLLILGGALITLVNSDRTAADQPLTEQMKTVIWEGDSNKEVTLPDNTKINLGDGAMLTFSDDFDQCREVYIEGEAYFSVTHDPDKPFIVRSNSITVTVHGTEFHVKAYPDVPTAEVKLAEGSVTVTAEGIQETIMVPGQHFIYHRLHRTTTLEAIGEGEILRLLKQNLRFDGHTLDESFMMMSQYFGTPFHVDPGIDLNERIAVAYEDDVKLEEAISLLQMITKTRFEYKIAGDTVTLTRLK